jgi:hypothetical protein
MKRIVPILSIVLASATLPTHAETPVTPEVEEGFNLMEEGAKLLLQGLMDEMEPALDEMGEALSAVEPALKDLQPKMMELLALIDDLTNYQPPERLENGDILIRRKPDAPAPPPLPTAPKSLEPAPQVDL